MPSPEEVEAYPGISIHSSAGLKLRDLKNVDVFFCPEVCNQATPQGATVVGVYHSLPETLNFNHGNNLRGKPVAARQLDYLVIAVRQKDEHWREDNYHGIQNIYPADMLTERRAALDIVPGGYPKLDYLENIACTGSQRYIIYASTSRRVQQSELEKHGRKIISYLLENFPEHEIVFRHYPNEDLDLVADIEAEFRTNPRFQVDRTTTGLHYLKDAALMVTDHSSVAVSLSLATRVPSVFVRFDATTRGEGKLGYHVNDTEGLGRAVTKCLSEREYWRTRIDETRANFIYQPGSSSAYLAEKLPVFAARGSDPDWLSVPRTPWVWNGEADTAAEHLDRLETIGQKSGHALTAHKEILRWLEK